ncbi:MAG TPA: HAD family phosphatase [Solirubrobacteraceae bacterium]|nr:HAD family phosphatase [Solirubrobacteraceae bacterium]
MLSGLLLDWGGVLTTSVLDALRSFCAREGLEEDAVTRRFRDDPHSRQLLVALETGALAESEFELRFAEVLGVAPAGLIERMFADSRPDEEMLAAVASARAAGVRTGLVSNSWGAGRYDREMLARLFDGVVISGEVGVRKPQPRIYELAAAAVGLGPQDCVFVDDLRVNVEGARALGMAAVHHRSATETIATLEALLGRALR